MTRTELFLQGYMTKSARVAVGSYSDDPNEPAPLTEPPAPAQTPRQLPSAPPKSAAADSIAARRTSRQDLLKPIQKLFGWSAPGTQKTGLSPKAETDLTNQIARQFGKPVSKSELFAGQVRRNQALGTNTPQARVGQVLQAQQPKQAIPGR